MSSQRKIIVPEDRFGVRLDSYLAEILPELSRSQLKKYIDGGQIQIAGQPLKAGLKLRGGEHIDLVLPEPEPAAAIPQPLPLKILYEDSHLIVIDKAAGMVVHPAAGHAQGTLVNALLHHCTDLAGIGGELRPGIVHRIDKDTSGVMVATKNDAAHLHLAEQFKRHSVTRRYLALVHGQVQNATGTIDKAIGRHVTDRKKMSSKTRQGKRAVTHWRVIKRYDVDRLTLVELTLETGRTHQIRVHFSELNLPLVGDPLYGSKSRSNAIGDLALRRLIESMQGQALHAAVLGLEHPVTGEQLEFRSELPDDFRAVIAYLDRKYAVPESSAEQHHGESR